MSQLSVLNYQFKKPTSFRKLSVDPLLCAKRNSRYARSFVLTARSFDLFALRGFSLVVRPSTTIKEKLPLLISRGERLGSKVTHSHYTIFENIHADFMQSVVSCWEAKYLVIIKTHKLWLKVILQANVSPHI